MLWLRLCNRRKRQNNCVFRNENIKKSCWYRYFTHPGLTREIMHELSTSNCLGGFPCWFCMSRVKVEELNTILIDRECITRLRSHHRKVFWERSELLVMSALYLLATGAAFCSCKPLCGIHTLEVRKVFYIFIEALVEMKDEYV